MILTLTKLGFTLQLRTFCTRKKRTRHPQQIKMLKEWRVSWASNWYASWNQGLIFASPRRARPTTGCSVNKIRRWRRKALRAEDQRLSHWESVNPFGRVLMEGAAEEAAHSLPCPFMRQRETSKRFLKRENLTFPTPRLTPPLHVSRSLSVRNTVKELKKLLMSFRNAFND